MEAILRLILMIMITEATLELRMILRKHLEAQYIQIRTLHKNMKIKHIKAQTWVRWQEVEIIKEVEKTFPVFFQQNCLWVYFRASFKYKWDINMYTKKLSHWLLCFSVSHHCRCFSSIHFLDFLNVPNVMHIGLPISTVGIFSIIYLFASSWFSGDLKSHPVVM